MVKTKQYLATLIGAAILAVGSACSSSDKSNDLSKAELIEIMLETRQKAGCPDGYFTQECFDKYGAFDEGNDDVATEGWVSSTSPGSFSEINQNELSSDDIVRQLVNGLDSWNGREFSIEEMTQGYETFIDNNLTSTIENVIVYKTSKGLHLKYSLMDRCSGIARVLQNAGYYTELELGTNVYTLARNNLGLQVLIQEAEKCGCKMNEMSKVRE